MKFTRGLVAAALSFIGSQVIAQKPSPGLCRANEEPVFSCTLEGSSHKMVSLCASLKSTHGEPRFYYLYGRPSKIELRYPINGGNEAFTFTHLRYAGATGGGAYAFTNEDYKYILFTIEGTGFKRSGLLVQRKGAFHAARDTACRQSTLVGSDNNELWKNISKWKVDPDIDAHGLPSTH